MALAFLAATASVLVKAFPPRGVTGAYPFSIEPIYAGLGVSLAVYTVAWMSGARAHATASPGSPPQEIPR
jgi:hypothetical protein